MKKERKCRDCHVDYSAALQHRLTGSVSSNDELIQSELSCGGGTLPNFNSSCAYASSLSTVLELYKSAVIGQFLLFYDDQEQRRGGEFAKEDTMTLFWSAVQYCTLRVRYVLYPCVIEADK